MESLSRKRKIEDAGTSQNSHNDPLHGDTNEDIDQTAAQSAEQEPASKKQKADLANVLQNSSGTMSEADSLVHSSDPFHPANHICELCRNFYALGWVTGTGGGVSIRDGQHVFIAPSGVQKELMRPTDMFVMDFESRAYLRRPPVGRLGSIDSVAYSETVADGKGRSSKLQHVRHYSSQLSLIGRPAVASIRTASGPYS